MNGDFTRLTFRPDNHYTGVRLQQGRLLLDADWNEQVDIGAYLDRTMLKDAVGGRGGPLHTAGFALRPTPGSPTLWNGVIGAGRFYVDGILCENEFETLFGGQPDLPGGTLPTTASTYVAYLDVWQRHLSALEKPELLEVALGGPDTTTRTRTVWQVKLERVGELNANVTCANFGSDWAPAGSLSTGRLRAQAEPGQATDSACLVPPGAGFRRLENQLYRVEIHTPPIADTEGRPTTFKWSRENASIITRLQRVQTVARQGGSNTLLTVSDTGRDATRGFAAGNWIELVDEQRILTRQPGIMVQLSAVNGNRLTVSNWPDGIDRPDNDQLIDEQWQVRRWDSATGTDAVRTGTPDQPVFIDLEDGVQVEFSGGDYRTGDYWLIPARTLIGDVDWPSVGGQPVFQRRHGVEHHYSVLALVRFDGTSWTMLGDCRSLFPPTSELVTLSYVGGGGQAAVADPARVGLRPLVEPLQARVTNGQWPVSGATVMFRILTPDASGPVGGTLNAGSASGAVLSVVTGQDGIASCAWTLDEDARHQSQRVVATLLDGATERSPVAFDAQLNRAALVAYTPGAAVALANARTVQDAIDLLAQSGSDREAAIHVVKISLQNGSDLANDTDVGVDAVAQGITIQCAFDQRAGQAVNPVSVNRATCYVAVELPYPLSPADRTLWGNPMLGFQPVLLAGQITVNAGAITWKPADPTATWLRTQLFSQVTNLTQIDRLLARMTLKGNFISSLPDGSNPPAFLDGDLFGSSGAQRTAAILPSGDGRRGGNLEMWFWLVQNAGLASLLASTGQVVGGNPVHVTVALTGPAPAAGTTIQIFIDGDTTGAIRAPASVSIQSGGLNAAFDVTTQPLTTPVTVAIRVVMTTGSRSESRAVTLTVVPPVADTLVLNANALDSGGVAQAQITLTGPAPAGGFQLRLATTDPTSTSFPDAPSGTILVPAGQNSISVRVATNPAIGNVTPTISATPSADGRPAQAVLTIRRLTISGPTFAPPEVLGGVVSTGTLTLSGAAPANGTAIDLAVPQRLTITDLQGTATTSVVVPAGSRTATFRAIPEGQLARAGLAVPATLRVGGATSTGTLFVTATVVAGLSLNPSTVLGGNLSTGTITLSGPAPREGAVINLSCTPGVVSFRNSAGALVGSVVVPAGGTTQTFQIATQVLDTGETQTVQIFASIPGQSSQSAPLVVRGPSKSPAKESKDIRDSGNKIAKDGDNLLKATRDGIDLDPAIAAGLLAPPSREPAEPATGRAFITPAERPNVGGAALNDAPGTTGRSAGESPHEATVTSASDASGEAPPRRARRARQSPG